MLCRKQDNRIDGVVITFVDVTQCKNQAELLAQALSVLEGRFDSQTEKLDRSQQLEDAAKTAQGVLDILVQRQRRELGKA